MRKVLTQRNAPVAIGESIRDSLPSGRQVWSLKKNYKQMNDPNIT